MKKAILLGRTARRLASTTLQGSSQGSFGFVAKPESGTMHPLSSGSRVGAVRFMGFGTFHEDHANATVPGAKENEVDDDEHPEVAIEKASHKLFRQSSSLADPGDSDEEEFQVKPLGREKPHADIASEVYSAKDHDGTSVFSDESHKG